MEVDSELIVGLKINSVFNTELSKDWGLFCPIRNDGNFAAGESSIRAACCTLPQYCLFPKIYVENVLGGKEWTLSFLALDPG